MKWDYRRMKLTNEKLRGNKTSLLDHYYTSWKGVCWGFHGRENEMIEDSKYIGKENRERFLILTSFSRRVSNVLSIPSDPLIPCEWFFRPPGSGFLFVNPSSLKNTTPPKLLKLLKPVVE
ncbi:hypothetical protein IGI04_036842 [Brassica rapa subsp. trilocularis]|uniref:Uncharacterized protein n=1 Tax=Brassica rapa subsp. trilocularis TaxID=1813537 RepID=A0ABQ7LFN3_BRACM|nr:hypothetical protein IGI04_036842 [Brassica rapa subsp. trilocularis]